MESARLVTWNRGKRSNSRATSYEWWSNALNPEQEEASNARGMPGGDVQASIWLVHNWTSRQSREWIVYTRNLFKLSSAKGDALQLECSLSQVDGVFGWHIQRSAVCRARIPKNRAPFIWDQLQFLQCFQTVFVWISSSPLSPGQTHMQEHTD